MAVNEGIVTFKELEAFLVVGRFDTVHLQAICSRIFKDLRHYPGQFRRDALSWVKSCEREWGYFLCDALGTTAHCRIRAGTSIK